MSLFNQEAVELKETQVLTYEEFFSLWEKTGNNFYWFVKNKERKTEKQISGRIIIRCGAAGI